MRGRRKAGVLLCAVWLLVSVLLAGCSRVKVPETLSVSAISVSGKGEVTAYLSEDFDKDYYDVSELEAMVKAEVSSFNESHQRQGDENAMEVVSVSLQEGGSRTVMLVLKFADIGAYRDYTGMELFYGTITQAYEEGCDLDVELASVKDGTLIGRTGILERSTGHILIVQDKVRIYAPSKPQFISTGAAMNEDGSVEASTAEENTYIIMK